MFRALLWKEWRQLRMLRWVGSALLVLTPPLLIFAAEASTRGWNPSGGASSYSMETLLLVAVPLVLGTAILLFAVMFTAQAYAGDRMEGTETFLLERPVPRTRTWLVRLLAVVGSIATVWAVALAVWAGWALVSTDPSPREWMFGTRVLGGAVSGGALLLTVGTMAAAVFIRSPMLAVLLGAVFSSVPAGLAFVLGGGFPYAAIGHFPIGFVLPAILLPAFVAASWLVCCRGEPAGRGKFVRGGAAVAVGLIAVFILFLVAAPIAVRAEGSRLPLASLTFPSATGTRAFFASPFGGWIVDLETTRRERFFGPSVYHAAWSQDGRWLAVVTDSGPLGSSAPYLRLDFYDATEDRVARSVSLPGDWTWVNRIAWAGEELVLASGRRVLPFLVASPHRDDVRNIVETVEPADPGGFAEWGFVGPTADGRLYVATNAGLAPESESGSDERATRPWNRPYRVFPVNVEEASLGGTPLVSVRGGYIYWPGHLLSRSGRYWFHVENRLDESGDYVDSALSVEDLETGTRTEVGQASVPFLGGSAWLEGETLIWLERREGRALLRTWQPGSTIDALDEFELPAERAPVYLDASPDGRRVLVTVREKIPPEIPEDQEPAEYRIARMTVFDSRNGTWSEMAGDPNDSGNPFFSTYWAGPNTIAWTGEGFIALEDVDDPGNLRYVLGGP